MKAITILQPWASLIVWGEKRFETRNWQSKHRGPIAIQAGRRFTDSARALCAVEPFNSVLRKHGVNFSTELPLGAIVGVAILEDSIPTDFVQVPEQEKAFGDFRQGRYAWKLTNPRALAEPIPFTGRLGIIDITDATINASLEQLLSDVMSEAPPPPKAA